MKNIVRTALLVSLVAGLAGGTAHAGQRWPTQPTGNVVIEKSSAWGLMGSARNSPDGAERIECSVSSWSTGSSATCTFQTSKAFAFCYSSAPEIVKAVAAVQSDSYVYVQFDPATAQCTFVATYQGSAYEPKSH